MYMEEHLGIELRSEKVRHIIGKIPPSLVRYGISYITLLLLLLGLAAFYIPYAESLKVELSVLPISGHEVAASALLPVDYANRVKKNMRVKVEMTISELQNQHHIEGRVVDIGDSLIIVNGKKYFNAIICMNTKNVVTKPKEGMSGVGFILLSDSHFIEYLFKRKR